MIGLILTGHGKFASGMHHAQTMIAGSLPHIVAIEFQEQMNLDHYQNLIQEQVTAMIATYGAVLILTDLKGGTPFNVSMQVANVIDKAQVISGTNLPMVIEGTLLSQVSDDPVSLAQQLITTGQTGIEIGQVEQRTKVDPLDEEEGI